MCYHSGLNFSWDQIRSSMFSKQHYIYLEKQNNLAKTALFRNLHNKLSL